MVRKKNECPSIWYTMAWRSAIGQTNSHMVRQGAREREREPEVPERASLGPANVRMRQKLVPGRQSQQNLMAVYKD